MPQEAIVHRASVSVQLEALSQSGGIKGFPLTTHARVSARRQALHKTNSKESESMEQIVVIEKFDRLSKSWGFLKVEADQTTAQRWISGKSKPIRYRVRVFVPQEQP